MNAPQLDPAGEDAFAAHLRRAGELVGARRLPEAEVELLHALSASPRDTRALKLLALVRFKLGRLADARAVYRTAREAAPEDAAVRLQLGLLALKLEWFEEAVVELESATRLRPDDQRAWSYLGYAYARTGASGRAAAAFRRAGQTELAEEVERRRAGAEPEPAPAEPGFEAPARADDEEVAAGDAAPLAGFAFRRLLRAGASAVTRDQGVLRFPVRDEAHVRQGALLAGTGGLALERARRRKRGRLTDEPLGAGGDGAFVRLRGAGELWLTPPPAARGLVALALDHDVVYLREDRVVAFDGEVLWEAGRVPWDGTPLLQFRGAGRVVLEATQDDVVALRVPEGEAVAVPRPRLLGWLGRIVAHSVRDDQAPPVPRIACEGEGVLLLSRHAEPAQPVHERPQPGDDGSGAADPRRPAVHR